MTALPERALTLYQPWAWLVVHGYKNVENRPKGFAHKSFRGDFWVHAASGPASDTARQSQWSTARTLCAGRLGKAFQLPQPDALDYGKIIGRARVVDLLFPEGTLLFKEGVAWHFPVQYGFVLEDARPATPVACRGYQGFWRVPAPVLEELKHAA